MRIGDKTFSTLDPKKHGVGGVVRGKIYNRKQDKRATTGEFYAVVFFPRIRGIGRASIDVWQVFGTLSNSPAAAKAKFMDGIRQGEKWATYARAGHRIRKVRITDLGDA